MTKTAPHVPPAWLEILDESEAELEAGLTVSSEVVINDLRESSPA